MRRFIGLACTLLVTVGVLIRPAPASAQDRLEQVQVVTGRLRAGEANAYRLSGLQAGDALSISVRATSGNLDPLFGLLDGAAAPAETLARYQAEARRLAAGDQSIAAALDALRDRTFLAWDDDGGQGYAAALELVVPAAGDYVLVVAPALAALGRETAGDYTMVIGKNAPGALAGEAAPVGAPIAEPLRGVFERAASVEVVTGTLTAATPRLSRRLVDLDAGDTLFVSVEATSGDLTPSVILRDFGGKPLEAGNLDGRAARATLEHGLAEGARGYALELAAVPRADGAPTEGDYRVLVGVNAPELLSGQAETQGGAVLMAPTEVQVGLKINRISQVNSPDEQFTILGNLRMDWTDPALAFSPDTCQCAVKLYTEKEFDRFLADVRSVWPDFTFFNQLGNRWVQSRAAAIWPDGRARYAESFSTTFQADFEFHQYPFDTQTFPIYLDLLLPTDRYTLAELPGYSGINPDHGEDEFILSDLTATSGTVTAGAADSEVSRLVWSFSAPRHLNYYILQVFVPIILIILISWFTFFLRDYSRRIEASAANVLLFIAFGFSLADNYPRLGYITYMDAVMGMTLIVNVLVLLYNVNMKRLENRGGSERMERVDSILDWLYPLLYLALIGLVTLRFF